MGIIGYVRMFFDLVVEFCFRFFYTKQALEPVTNDMLLLCATELAAGIRARKFTVESVVRAYINRIYDVNAALNAVVDFRFEEALAEASALDDRMAHVTREEFETKPFLGVPFTAKESTLCQDMSASFGLVQRENVRAECDAAVIRNMKNAGAILLGVTNVPQLNLWVETHNPVYGITRNPYDTTCTTGGSSGGEAAIIAACGSPFGVGTDIGGSIRIPSFMCGVFGHKCSNGLTDTTGLTFRDGSEAETTMVTVGPICRKSADLIPGIQVLLGSKADALHLSVKVDTKKLRYFCVEQNGDPRCSPVRADVAYMNQRVFNHFKKDSQVEMLDIPNLKYSSSLYKYWLETECGGFASDITNRTGTLAAGSELWKYLTWRSNYSFSVIMVLMSTQWLPKPNPEWAKDVTSEIRKFLLAKLKDDGVLLFPSWPQTATQHHVGYLRPFNYAYTSIFNLLKLPVTQVPLGLSKSGLPFGIQVVAAPMNDRLCVAVARELEEAFGGWVHPLPPSPQSQGKW